jgi:hypothetical protein
LIEYLYATTVSVLMSARRMSRLTTNSQQVPQGMIDPELKNRLFSITQRALSDAIALHGPITRNRTSSAAKRVVGQLLSHLHGTGHLKGPTATMTDRTNTNELTDFASSTTAGVDERLRAFTQRLMSVLETELFEQSRELMGQDLLRDVNVIGWSEPLAAQFAQQAADSLRDLLVRRVDLIIGYRDGHWEREHVYVSRSTSDAELNDAAVQRCSLEMDNPLDVAFIMPATDARSV